MSEGIRKRAAPSVTTRSGHRPEEKSDANVVKEKEELRWLVAFVVNKPAYQNRNSVKKKKYDD